MVQTELIHILNIELNTELPQAISEENLVQRLSEFISHLIQTNFQRLLLILYRVDVSEKKIKQLLQKDSSEDAAIIIAKLIIEREAQKIYSRNLFSHKNDICDEEKW
ncbi:MAG: hypothetical protein ABJA71_04860 [Ginsengibacter sp.]